MKSLLFALLCCAVLPLQAATESTEKILQQLDETISLRGEYQQNKEREIAQLKARLSAELSPTERYELYSHLFGTYLHYQADSALCYTNLRMALITENPAVGQMSDVLINRAEVMAVMGLYHEAATCLQQVDPNTLNREQLGYYYHAYRSYFGWLADYTPSGELKAQYIAQTAQYRDSVVVYSGYNSTRTINIAEQKIIYGAVDEGLTILKEMLANEADERQRVYLYYTLAEAYKHKGDTEQQVYYLALTAINDLKSSIREYASLQELALLMYEIGDIDRAYLYLSCAMEDAVAANARLRFIEVAEFYPIIEVAYKQKDRAERHILRIMIMSITTLSLFLFVAICYLYYWMKKLSAIRHELNEANIQLQKANEELVEAGKIKEVYIARYLDRCVSYLDKLEAYRQSLGKLAITSRIEELVRTIKSEQFIRDERKHFYDEFDHSFLELFPHFVDEFNNLLNADEQVYPKAGQLLNTELRIFALIRLGVTDSNRIAHFLSYSLATIYSYRSKMRLRAKDKEHFENLVMKL